MTTLAETTTGLASSSGHWYDRYGRPCYDILGANGKMRPVTLRDARKLGLVPGFTSIAKMEASPALTNWLLEQAYLACMTLPRIEGEAPEAFIKRAKADAGAQAEKARDRGTELHAAIEGYYLGQEVSPAHRPYVFPVVRWLAERFPHAQWLPEKSFAHPLGVGTKIDLHFDGAVVDFKCKDFKEPPERSFAYPEHGMQLVLGREMIKKPTAVLLNLFISSTVPGLIVPHEWSEEEAATQWEAFKLLLALWKLRRNYNGAFSHELSGEG
jgi:hypothetical protein